MKKQSILFILSFVLLSFCLTMIEAKGIYYEVNISFEDGILEISEVRVIFLQYKEQEINGDYKLVLTNEKNILETKDFFVPNKASIDYVNESSKISNGEIIEQEKLSFMVLIPYNELAKNIVILNENKEVASFKIDEYSKDYMKSNYEKESINESNYEKENIIKYNKQNKENYRIKTFIISLFLVVIITLLVFWKLYKR